MSFDGTREYGPAPRTMMGVKLLSQLEQEKIRTVYDFQDLLGLNDAYAKVDIVGVVLSRVVTAPPNSV